jgi:hypothetical protein
MWEYYNAAMNQILRLGMWEWFAVGLVVLFFGFFCMRGYGSRSNY